MRRASLLSAMLFVACTKAPVHTTPLPDETVRIPGGSSGATPATMTISRTATAAVRTVAGPAPIVYATLPKVYATLGIPISERNAEAQTIGTTSYKVRRRLGDVALSRYLDCGSTQGAPSADTYEVLLTMNSKVQAAGTDSTTVMTTVTAQARPVAFSSDYITCGTKGGLERRFYEILDLELRG